MGSTEEAGWSEQHPASTSVQNPEAAQGLNRHTGQARVATAKQVNVVADKAAEATATSGNVAAPPGVSGHAHAGFRPPD